MSSFTPASKLFNENEMTPDVEREKPTITLIEAEEDEAGVKDEPEELRSDAWFNQNKLTRVPVIALEPDMYQIDGQAYACFSVIKPEDYGALHHGDKGYKGFLIKFRGVFPSREDADRHIRKVMGTDRHFDVHLVPCFQWAKMDEDDVSEREHTDETISDIMKGYFKEENKRMKNVRDRINNTEEGYETRSGEATDFFEKSLEDTGPIIPSKPSNAKPMSLTELAEGLGIEARASTIVTQGIDETMEKKHFESIVSEVLED